MKLKEQVNTTYFLAAAEPSVNFPRAMRGWLSTASFRRVKLFPIDGEFH